MRSVPGDPPSGHEPPAPTPAPTPTLTERERVDARAELPHLERTVLDEVADRSADETRHFLDVRRLDLALVREDGARSVTFRYDIVDRRALDACVMVAHAVIGETVFVYLRSAVRPPVALRPIAPKLDGALWEVPAGLIEPGESPQAAARRELEEELGFAVALEALVPLGPPAVPAPGFIGEIHHYFHVRVDPSRRAPPAGDGSPLEDGALVVCVPLDHALAACRAGAIPDAKTELALRRLVEHLPPAEHRGLVADPRPRTEP